MKLIYLFFGVLIHMCLASTPATASESETCSNLAKRALGEISLNRGEMVIVQKIFSSLVANPPKNEDEFRNRKVALIKHLSAKADAEAAKGDNPYASNARSFTQNTLIKNLREHPQDDIATNIARTIEFFETTPNKHNDSDAVLAKMLRPFDNDLMELILLEMAHHDPEMLIGPVRAKTNSGRLRAEKLIKAYGSAFILALSVCFGDNMVEMYSNKPRSGFRSRYIYPMCGYLLLPRINKSVPLK